MGTMVEFKRPDGQVATGWLAEAENALASVVVIQEWWGLNEQIRGVAERFASAGFRDRKSTRLNSSHSS